MPILIALALVITGGAGVSIAADNAVPGDSLYGWKLGVNEEIRETLAFSNKADAEVAIDRVGNRAEEAIKLAVENKLNADLATQLESRLESHFKEFEENLSRIESKGEISSAVAVASDAEASLRAHREVLASLSSNQRVMVESMIAKIRARLSNMQKKRADLETAFSAKVGADAESAASKAGRLTKSEIEKAEDAVSRAEGNVRAEVIAKAEARIAEAKRITARAGTQLEAESFRQAFAMYHRAHRLAVSARIIVQGHYKIRVDIESSDHRNSENNSDESNDTKNSDTNIKAETQVDVEGDENSIESEGRIDVRIDL